MDQVVAQDCSFLDAQRVNAAHIAQHALADVVEMIELDDVFTAGRFLITPVPSDGDGGVVKVVNVIVHDVILAALENDDADCRREDAPELMQMVVSDDLAEVLFKRVLPPRRFATRMPPPAMSEILFPETWPTRE